MTPQKLFTSVLTTAVMVASFGLAASSSRAAGAPNIVLLMSDDMGFSDIGCYGGEINTPNLDQLANGGVRFSQFYNTARCCPTRASLISGLYPHQAGIGHMMNDRGVDGYRGELNRNCVTIAEALKPAGYATYCVGKWHMTKHTQPTDDSRCILIGLQMFGDVLGTRLLRSRQTLRQPSGYEVT